MLLRLLKFLLNHLLFGSTMFLDAGAVTLTDGGGGSDGGAGDAGGDSGGDADTDPTSSSDSGDDSRSESESDNAAEGAEGVDRKTDPNALVDSGDGRKIPAKYAELFKGDKFLREMFFSQAQLRRAFPGGAKEAAEFKNTVEELGGVDGIEQVKSEIATYQADSELFAKSDPKWVEAGFSENPEAALSAMRHSLSLAAEKFPEHYDHIAAGMLFDTIGGYDPSSGKAFAPIMGIRDALLASKDPQAQQLGQQLKQWFDGIALLSRKAPQKIAKQGADQETQKLTQEKQQLRNEKINIKAVPYLKSAIETVLDKLPKPAGFDLAKLRKDQPKRYERFMTDVKNAVHTNVRGDEKWLSRYSDALAAGDTQKCVRMLNSRHDQAIQGNDREPGVVAGLFAEWFGTGKAAAAKPGNDKGADRGKNRSDTQRSQGSAAVRVTAMPSKSEIDWQHPKTKIIDQVAMRRDGKLVTWAS